MNIKRTKSIIIAIMIAGSMFNCDGSFTRKNRASQRKGSLPSPYSLTAQRETSFDCRQAVSKAVSEAVSDLSENEEIIMRNREIISIRSGENLAPVQCLGICSNQCENEEQNFPLQIAEDGQVEIKGRLFGNSDNLSNILKAFSEKQGQSIVIFNCRPNEGKIAIWNGEVEALDVSEVEAEVKAFDVNEKSHRSALDPYFFVITSDNTLYVIQKTRSTCPCCWKIPVIMAAVASIVAIIIYLYRLIPPPPPPKPTPTPSPIPSPTPTPWPSPIMTPTPTPWPSPIMTPTPSSIPTPTPSPTPSQSESPEPPPMDNDPVSDKVAQFAREQEELRTPVIRYNEVIGMLAQEYKKQGSREVFARIKAEIKVLRLFRNRKNILDSKYTQMEYPGFLEIGDKKIKIAEGDFVLNEYVKSIQKISLWEFLRYGRGDAL
ncbi:MAG: hypothetical protein LBQ03_00715 [Puniceicoccales bacterium]|jgi:hypothetical protein|nr:hypothetical protein [Puniceicoccales bacterium]